MTFDCLLIGEKTMKILMTIIRSVVALVGVAGRNSLSIQFMKTNLNRFSLLCAVSKKQFPVRTTCVKSLLPLLLVLTLPVAVQAQYNYLTKNGAITITKGNCFDGAVAIPDTIDGLPVTSIGDYAFYFCTNLTGVHFKGNAPSAEYTVFPNANQAIVYFLPGTTGWGPTFGGRPAVLWNPQVQSSDSSFGVQANQFGFTITGTSGLVLVVEACTNLVQPAWSALGTNTLIGGSTYFGDPQWTNYPNRLYRLRTP